MCYGQTIKLYLINLCYEHYSRKQSLLVFLLFFFLYEHYKEADGQEEA